GHVLGGGGSDELSAALDAVTVGHAPAADRDQFTGYGQFVVEVGGGAVTDLDARHGEREAGLFHLAVTEPAPSEPFHPPGLEPDAAGAVLRSPHLVVLGDPYPELHRPRSLRQRWRLPGSITPHRPPAPRPVPVLGSPREPAVTRRKSRTNGADIHGLLANT